MKLKALIHRDKKGGYWAEIPGLPGCVTQAETKAQLEKNIKEAARSWVKCSESASIKRASAKKNRRCRTLNVCL